jgi:hypothetical protein
MSCAFALAAGALHGGFVARIEVLRHFPFPRTDLPYGLCDRYAKSGEAVEHGYAELDFRD